MYPVSDAFLSAVRRSHIAVTKVDIYDVANGKLIATPQVVGGEVTIDNRRAVRRQCTVELVDNDGSWVPVNPKSSTLLVFNREMRVYRGIQFADGTQELVPLGVFSITDVDIEDGKTGVRISVTGSDRSLVVMEAKFTDHSFWIASGTAKEDAIYNILKSRYPSIVCQFPQTGQVTGLLYPTLDKSSDPWKEASAIASSAGMDLYFDEKGTCRMRPIPGGAVLDGVWVPSATLGRAVATYADGADAVFTSLSRKLSRQDSYNGVIYTGEGTNLTLGVIGTAWDDDPSSPTYRKTYGEKPKYMSSPTVLTSAEALIAAKAELLKVIGASETVKWSQIVNPSHDAYDVVKVTRSASGIDSSFVIDTITIPFDPKSTMSAEGRSGRFV